VDAFGPPIDVGDPQRSEVVLAELTGEMSGVNYSFHRRQLKLSDDLASPEGFLPLPRSGGGAGKSSVAQVSWVMSTREVLL